MSDKVKNIHPITDVILKSVKILDDLGFSVALGPELELEKYNFDMLNVPKDHPARDMQDTFWIKPNRNFPGVERTLMRTHTSPVQARFMEKNKPPFRIVCPGKVYRQEATDARHEMMFHQIEGLFVDKDVSLATLKSVLNEFFKKFFERDVSVRFRPSYFPFVEPGTEVDISCIFCKGDGKCPVCGGSGWLEVMGAGLVHPRVLNNVGIDSNKWRGFAFGVGVDRLAMLKYGIDDIRLFYSGDLRLVNQFKTKK